MRTVKMKDIDLEAIEKDGLNSLLQDLKGRKEIKVDDVDNWFENEEAEKIGLSWKMKRYIKQKIQTTKETK